MPDIRLAQPLLFDSVVDGPGLRCVIWFQGCPHHCENCHNPQTHDTNTGNLTEVEEILSQLKRNPSQTGITISGGEPFHQADALLHLLRKIRTITSSIWLYTGFTFEELTDESHSSYETRMRILGYLDVLIDGKYIDKQKNRSLLFRGSSNQRLIDMHRTIWMNEVVSWEEKSTK